MALDLPRPAFCRPTWGYGGPVTLWEEVDERVLRWVFALPPMWGREKLLDLPIKHPQPVDGLDGIDSRTLAESLRRLHGFGLVDGTNDEYDDGEGYGA